jgi:predicted dehydrogenase
MPTDSRPLRVGIVGCGKIVQTAHLAALSGIGEVEVAAVCDVDESVLDRVAARLGVTSRYTSYHELVTSPDLDAVLVATPDHAGPSIAALDAGKHLLVEKPLSSDPGTARQIQDAARRSAVVAMVGYMKRYDWCFERFCRLVSRLPEVRYARAHDFACRFDKSDYLFDIARPGAGGASRLGSRLEFIDWLLLFASHDFAVIRGAIGEPEEVVFAEAAGPRTLAVGLRCQGRRFCLLEISLDTHYEWFDETLTVYGDEQVIAIRFADPFVPFAQSAFRVRQKDEQAAAQTITTGPFEDAFRRQWRHFAHCIRCGEQPRTPLAEGTADAELAAEIASRMHWPSAIQA